MPGLIRSTCRIDLCSLAKDDGTIDGNEVMAKASDSRYVVIEVAACEQIEEADGRRRPGAPYLLNGLHFRKSDGFTAVEIVGDGPFAVLAVVNHGIVFEGVPAVLHHVRFKGENWGGKGFPAAIIDLRRDPETQGSTNSLGDPEIANCSIEFANDSLTDRHGVALANRGQEMLSIRDSRLRADNGTALLLDTDTAGDRTTMSGVEVSNCNIMAYGTGLPIGMRGAVTQIDIGRNTWIHSQKWRTVGDDRPLTTDAIRIMTGASKVGSAGLPRDIDIEFTPEGNAKHVVQFGLGEGHVVLRGRTYTRGVREVPATVLPALPGVAVASPGGPGVPV